LKIKDSTIQFKSFQASPKKEVSEVEKNLLFKANEQKQYYMTFLKAIDQFREAAFE
jgi:hypothetical protein